MLQNFVTYRKRGGWLQFFYVLFILGLILNVLSLFGMIFLKDDYIATGLFTPSSYLINFGISVVSTILTLLIIIFMTKRNALFKTLYLISFIVTILSTAYSIFTTQQTDPMTYATTLISSVLGVVLSGLILVYFHRSERVKVYLLPEAVYNSEYMRLRQEWEQQMQMAQPQNYNYQ